MKTEVEVIVRAFLAQSVERAAFNRKVVGSRPTGGVFYSKKEQEVKEQKSEETEKSRAYMYERSHGVGAAYEILVLRTPVRIWVEPFFCKSQKGGIKGEGNKKRQRQDSNLRLQRRSDF